MTSNNSLAQNNPKRTHEVEHKGTARTPKPARRLEYRGVPDALRSERRFVCTRLEWNDKLQKWDKIPINPITGDYASSTNPETWGDFDTAFRRLRSNRDLTCLGFVLGNGFVGVDLDHKVGDDGEVDDDTARIVGDFNTYTERSISKTGLHLIGIGAKPDGRCKNGDYEAYAQGRFFALTGDVWPGTDGEVEDVTIPLADFQQRYLEEATRNEAPPPPLPLPTQEERYTDAQVLDAISHAPNHAAIAKLQEGTWEDDYKSQSNADMALCVHYAYYTGRNAAQMDRLFRQSGLMRDKWDSKRGNSTWGARTIAWAINRATKEWAGPVHKIGAQDDPYVDAPLPNLEEMPAGDDATDNHGEGNSRSNQSKTLVASVPQVEQSDNDAPDTRTEYLEEAAIDLRTLDLGWVSTFASLTCRMSGSPHEFNVMGALVALAGAVGNNARLQMFGGLPLNLYGCLVAPSTVYRKSSSTNYIIELYKRAGIAQDRLLSSRFTMEGLLAELSDRADNAGLVVKNEITSLFGAHRVQYQGELKPTITDLYDGTWLRRRLSKVTYTIERPNLSIIGSIQPGTFYEDVGAFDWQTGFLPRWLFVVPTAAPDFDQTTYSFNQADENALTDLANRLGVLRARSEVQMTLAPDAFNLWDSWQRAEQKRAYATDDERMMAIAGRYNTMALKLAALVAIAHDEWGAITYGRMMTGMLLIQHYKGNLLRLMSEQDERAVDGSKLQKVLVTISTANKRGLYPTARELCQALHEKGAVMAATLDELRRLRAIITRERGRAVGYVAVMDRLPAAR